MKTFLEKLLIRFDLISHPAAGSGSNKEGQRKRKGGRNNMNLSPESYNLRSNSKKQNMLRRTPAP